MRGKKVRLIDADKVKNGVMEFANKYGEIVGMFVTDLDILVYGCSVDAEPVVHGHWIDEFCAYQCSVCHCHIDEETFDDYRKPNYCPNCGAKMDAEVDGGEEDADLA